VEAHRNPWLNVPAEPPFVLPDDLPGAVPFQLHCRIPAPWHGPIRRAKVVLLLRNSGHGIGNIDEASDPVLAPALRRQLSGDEPFLWVEPEWKDTSGAGYWLARLRRLIDDLGRGPLSSGFAIAQAIPYASSYQIDPQGPIPSAAFTGELVADAHRRGALLIVGRAAKEWRELVPELFEDPSVPVLGRPRAVPDMTPSRFGTDLYDRAVRALSSPG
jgi:hypothetical protein